MRGSGVLLMMVLAARAATASSPQCDPDELGSSAEKARSNIIAAVDGAGALEAWKYVVDHGGALAWSATEYNVDARSTFVFTFDRTALRVYRGGAFKNSLEEAMSGCLDPAVEPEATIPWQDVREIEAGNWVVWFRFRKPVEIRSDRGKHHRVNELKAFFYGASGSELTYHYDVKWAGRDPFWNFDVYTIENLRGIAVGPTDFQRRFQFILARVVDPAGRIALPRKGPGAGW